MSSTTPAQPEYLGPEQPRSGGRSGGGRTTLLVALAVVVVAIVAGAAYGVTRFLGGGATPASAVPGSAIGYVSLDLDPSASQKIEAIKILRKFPALRKEIKIGSRDDVRRRIFDEISKDGDCSKLDFDDDIKPWLGNRVALAAVPGAGDKVMPLVALQVSDQDKARVGLGKLEKCGSGDGDDTAVAFSGDYALISEKQADVDKMAKAADSSSLEDDADFKTWMDRAGDSGIVTMYAAPDAVDVAFKAVEKSAGNDLGGELANRQLDTYKKTFKDFDGAAGVIRFKNGGVEADFSSKGLQDVSAAGAGKGPDVETLPGSTAAVLSLALKDGWLDGYVDQLRSAIGADQFDRIISQGEQQTGLQLPDDIETLLGDGVSISVDSSADLAALQDGPDLEKVPAGIRITGDADKITAIIDKLKAAAGQGSEVVKVKSSGDTVAVGTSEDYLDSLLKKGDLGDQKSFKDVVPKAGKSSVVLYVDFDAAGKWAKTVADGDREVEDNLKPLNAVGASSWTDGDKVQHALIRLTTD